MSSSATAPQCTASIEAETAIEMEFERAMEAKAGERTLSMDMADRMRRLAKENHLLRLQLLRLREQTPSSSGDQSAAASPHGSQAPTTFFKSDAVSPTAASQLTPEFQQPSPREGETCPAAAAALLSVVSDQNDPPSLLQEQQQLTQSSTAPDDGNAASAVRQRMLARQLERVRRAAAVKELLHDVEKLQVVLTTQQQRLERPMTPEAALSPPSPPPPLLLPAVRREPLSEAVLEEALLRPDDSGSGGHTSGGAAAAASHTRSLSTASAGELRSVQQAYDEMLQRSRVVCGGTRMTTPRSGGPSSSQASAGAGAAVGWWDRGGGDAVTPIAGGRLPWSGLSADDVLQQSNTRKALRQRRLHRVIESDLSTEEGGQLRGPDGAASPFSEAGGGATPLCTTVPSSSRSNTPVPSRYDRSTHDNTANASGAVNGSYRVNKSTKEGPTDGPSRSTAPPTIATTTKVEVKESTTPVVNPNQIGTVISDATKNNSWYLCKVLEAAFLDTILGRPTEGESTAERFMTRSSESTLLSSCPLPATSTRSSPPLRPSAHELYEISTILSDSSDSITSLLTVDEASSTRHATAATRASTAAVGTTTTTTTPLKGSNTSAPLLYQSGVSDTALQRAISETLILPYRCIGNEPRRLTASQAAEEVVPTFDTENWDGGLCRCFGSATTATSSAHSSTTGVVGGRNLGGSGTDHGGESASHYDPQEELDPFARLLLSRMSASSSSHGSGMLHRQREVSSFLSSSSKKLLAPKRHFPRLDEVQVELHAPVIFKQIRRFLCMDIHRFRSALLSAAGSPSPPPSTSISVTPGAAASSPVAAGTAGSHNGTGGGTSTTTTTGWRMSVSPGKSKTTLLYIGDCVMKTVRESEFDFLMKKFLPSYVRYCERNPHTMLPRFFAVVTVRWWKAGVVQRFILMQNVFATQYYINRIYDVKGSTIGRTALQPGKPPPRTAFGAMLLKDNDLPSQLIICGAFQRAVVLAQLRSDVEFLRRLGIVDYSCMVGVRSRLLSREEGPSKAILLSRRERRRSKHGGGLAEEADEDFGRGKSTVDDGKPLPSTSTNSALSGGQWIGVGGAVAATVGATGDTAEDASACIHGCDGGLLSLPIYSPGDDTTAREDVYYLGIIDVLQTYNSAKKLESFAKGLINDRSQISVVPPDAYAERLYNVLERISV